MNTRQRGSRVPLSASGERQWSKRIDETLERLLNRGAQPVGEVVQYKDAYRLCYILGPEGLFIGLAQELS